MCSRSRIIGGLALVVLALTVTYWSVRAQRRAAEAPGLPRLRLASRTQVLAPGDMPDAFVPASRLTVRGTALYMVVADRVPGKAFRERLAACGARVISYLPDRALLVEVAAPAFAAVKRLPGVVAVQEFGARDRVAPGLRKIASSPGIVPIAVRALTRADIPVVEAAIAKAGYEVDGSTPEGSCIVRAKMAAAVACSLADCPEVRWVECSARPQLFNDVAVKPGLMNVTPVRETYGLTGNGQNIVTADSGIDTGSTSTLSPDFTGRIYNIKRVDRMCQKSDSEGHGTHTAGSLVGTGSNSVGQIRGVAYGARLFVWAGATLSGNLYVPSIENLFKPDHNNFPAYINSDSWGDTNTAYTANTAEFDAWLWKNPEFLAVFAAGNSGSGSYTIGDPAGGKNILSVGASESLRPEAPYYWYSDNAASIASFSSRGPMPDGRIKPDLCAPGTCIVSVRSRAAQASQFQWGIYSANTNYAYNSGTSMATPLVAGSAALVREWLQTRQGFTNTLPSAALMKAILAGGAYDMSADTGASCVGAAPNNAQGWGRVDLGETLFPSNRSVRLKDGIPFAQDAVTTFEVTVTNTAPLAVQLAWTDYEGDPAAAVSLVNDLDLVVSNETTGAVWLGNDTLQTGTADHINNMESVRLAAAEPAVYSISVKGVQVPYDYSTGGSAAVYVRGALASDEGEERYVSLTIATEGEETGATDPAVQTMRVKADTILHLGASAVTETNAYGTVIRRREVAGWTGTGSVPETGTNDSLTVSVQEDSTLTWRWDEKSDWLFRRWLLIPSYGTTASGEYYYWSYTEDWLTEGDTWYLGVPDAVPGGALTVDFSNDFPPYYYTDSSGNFRRMTVQHLGRIEVADVDGSSGEPIYEKGTGRMAMGFYWTVDAAADVLYYFWDAAHTNLTTGLPEWWYQFYLAGSVGGTAAAASDADADGDGISNAAEYLADTDPVNPLSVLRITGFTPSSLTWQGGVRRVQYVERASQPGTAADWQPVYTNLPPTAVTNTCTLPSASSNAFYRIRAVGD